MKKIIDIVESKTSDSEIKHYIQSWLKQDREKYGQTLAVIIEAAMDYFKDEMDYYNDKSKIASGNQSSEFNTAAIFYKKVKDMYSNI